MNDFINIVKKDPEVRVKMKDMFDRYNKLLYNYQSKIGYDTLIQNVILKKVFNITGGTIIDLDLELKIKICGMKFLEKRETHIIVFTSYKWKSVIPA